MANTESKSGEMVTVGCRLPHGIKLDLYKDGILVGSQVLAGKNDAVKDMPIMILTEKMCGYTTVEKSFMDAWLKDNPNNMAYKSGAIFIEKTLSDAKAANEELKDEKTGFEPSKPESDNGVITPAEL